MARQFQEQLEEEVDLDRNRTIRPEPVRPVGGTAQPVPPPLEPDPEVAAPAAAAEWQPLPADPLPGPAASPADHNPEPLTPGTHERGT
jgi:hypothetical protein